MSRSYTPKVDRRTTLKWVASLMAASAYGCGDSEKSRIGDGAGLKADLGAPGAVSGGGYGGDPDLMNPTVPWEKTMTQKQLRLAAALSDMIIPEDDVSPAASGVGVPDFIDEWVSAPYPDQQKDRQTVFSGLEWIEQQSLDRFARGFADADDAQKAQILDDIAYDDRAGPEFETAAVFFGRFRSLVMGAFYSTEEGVRDIGYIGNRPMGEAYPGPTPEAIAHLNRALAALGLEPVETP